MGTFISVFNICVLVLFTACFFYQFIYVFVVFARKPKQYVAKKNHRYAVLICGRNESAVIGNLVKSLKEQTYPSKLFDIFVIADNCTDNTAQVAAEAGAIVYERFNQVEVGKSYALDYALNRIFKEYTGEKRYEGYFVFDADNVVDQHFIEEMNAVFDNGFSVVTSYRNSKNYDSSWISAGYSLWFMREGKYLSQARNVLGSSCAISGTGFLIAAEILEADGGWTHHLLTEDIEFSVDSIIHGVCIGYAPKAIVFDEQPITFTSSWHQRLRWSRGFYQVLLHYGKDLLKGIFEGKFACYDMLMTIAPAILLTLLAVIVNGACLLYGYLDLSLTHEIALATTSSIFFSLSNFCLMMFAYSVLVTITEWNQIHASTGNKIKYIFTFPFYMLTYIPIALTALFKKVEWKPIAHTVVKSTQEIVGEKQS